MPVRKALLVISALAFSSMAASAADMAMRTKAPPIVVDPSYNWSGFYIGGNVGYGWGDADTSFNPLPSAAAFVNLAPTTLAPDPQGVVGGVQAGYNWQAGKFVFGLEADIQASDIHGNALVTPIIQNSGAPFPGAGFLAASQRIDWFGTVRARAGFTPVDRLLLYVTGGLAYGNVSYNAQTDFRPGGTIQYPASFSRTKTGWTAGAGAEWAFAQNWTAKVEYLYIDLGNESTIANPVPANPPFQVGYNWRTTEQIARVGLNYKFGWGGPVVAKY
ncbi:outer membrane protein [Bradyrhizobium sp. URHC0002]